MVRKNRSMTKKGLTRKVWQTALVGLLLTVGGTTVAAQQTPDSSVYNESVIVVGDFNPVLEQSFKLNVAPQIVDTALSLQHTFQYGITPRRLRSIFQPTRIKAAKIIGEPTSRLYNNYFRLGFGNNWSTLLDGYYNSTRDQRLTYGVGLHHRSSWGTVGIYKDDIAPQADYWGPAPFSESALSLFGKYILKGGIQVSSALDYSHDYNLYYGFSDSLLYARRSETRENLTRRSYASSYHKLQWQTGIKSLNTDVKRLGYEANVGLGNLWGRYGMGELHASADGKVHYGLPAFEQHRILAYLQLHWDGFLQRRTAVDTSTSLPLGFTGATWGDTSRYARNIFTINPYIDFLLGGFKFHAGARLTADGYSDADSAQWYLLPDVVMSKSFLNEAFNLSAGITGNVEPQSWDAIRMVNAYVMPAPEVRASRHYDFYARARFNFSKRLQLNVAADYSLRRNELGFQLCPDYALDNVFRSTFSPDFNRIRIGGSLAFESDEQLSAELGGNYYSYEGYKTGGNKSYLAYRPTAEGFLTLHANFSGKVLVHLQGVVVGRMASEYHPDAYGMLTESDTLPLRAGFNMEVEYVHNRALSFFLKVDNLLAQRYFLWANYPSHRLTALVGLTYTIPTKRQ